MSGADRTKSARHRILAPWLLVPACIANELDWLTAQARKDADEERQARALAVVRGAS